MSALWAPTEERTDPGATPPPPRPRLRALPSPGPRLARVPFLLVLIGVFGAGMAGLLMLNTTLQNQAFQARTLQRQATELTYVQTDLENQLDQRAAPQELARRASLLGMRPDPYPALLVMPEGRVVGDAKPVTGRELPSLVVLTEAQAAAERAAAEAKRQAAAAERTARRRAEVVEAVRRAAQPPEERVGRSTPSATTPSTTTPRRAR